MAKKLLVVGLDCLEPSLAFERWRGHMPVLSRLMERGVWGRMRSTIPPITIPAWQCMVTGKDPGTLGMYGFRNRKDYTYDAFQFADGRMVREPRVWDVLSRAGLDNIILGVPQTWPPKPLRGCMVSGFPLPDMDGTWTYPATLKHEIAEVCDYIPDAEDFRTENKQAALDVLITMAERRFKLAAHLLKTRPWDFFMMVEMGTDRIVHLLWRYTDETHRHYVPDHPLNNAMRDYYALCDRLMGELIAPYENDPDTAICVVSDHGARGMDGGIRINEWLIRNGYLKLKERPAEPTGMGKLVKADLVDWPNTRVWAEGGYYSRVMVNVKGREPNGSVEPAAVPALLAELAEKLKAIPDDRGNAITTHVYTPEQTYSEVKNIPPDLIVIFGDLGWRSIGSVGPDADAPLHVFENDTGPDDANHNWDGVFALAGGGVPAKGELPGFGWDAFAPTVLKYFNQPVPTDMQGRALDSIVPE
jgi:predicted AlkP superfamily phosphohydrolase/phosphomutase